MCACRPTLKALHLQIISSIDEIPMHFARTAFFLWQRTEEIGRNPLPFLVTPIESNQEVSESNTHIHSVYVSNYYINEQKKFLMTGPRDELKNNSVFVLTFNSCF